MNTPFLKKYQPQKYSDFIIDPDYIKLLKTMINMNNLNLLLIGNNGSGKTSLIEATIREYYNLEQIPKHNVLIISHFWAGVMNRRLQSGLKDRTVTLNGK